MFTLFVCDVADLPAYVLFEFRLIVHRLDYQEFGIASDARLNCPQAFVGNRRFLHQRAAEIRILHVVDFIFFGTGRDCTPGGGCVVEVPVFQRESEARAAGTALA